jgi:hypothetical protein
MKCLHCDEPIGAAERVHMMTTYSCMAMHLACLVRNIVGSIAHQQKQCSCYGGTDSDDPPGVSKFQAARDAAKYYATHSDAQPDPYNWNA